MKKFISKALCLSAVFSFGLSLQSSWGKTIHSKAGTSAFPFLKINVGARAVGMGGAFTGLADDESALYYNPAGITSLEGKHFILGYHNYFVDMQSGFLGYITRVRDNLSLGGWVTYFNYGDFIETDTSGTVLGEFSGSDMLGAVTLALRHNHNVSFGATVKFIYEQVHDYSSTGLAIDLGAKYASDRGRYGAGVMVQNLGKQLSALDVETYRMPLTIRAGVSVRPRAFPLVLAGDLVVPVDNDLTVVLGADYYKFEPFYVRIGWNSFGSNFRGVNSDDNWAGLSVGVGFDHKKLHIAYSFSPGADLGESHRVTLTGSLR
jgi:hypothetical protein